MTWQEIKDAWSSGWNDLEQRGIAAYRTAIEANPMAFADHVVAFMNELALSRAYLDAMRSKLGDPRATDADRTAYLAFEQRWHDLAAGLYADAQVAPTIGVAPIVVGLVVGGVVLTLAAIAWAVVAYQYAVNLREQTALADRDLQARVEASKDGRTLPATTLPPPPADPIASAKNLGLLLMGALTLAAGVAIVPSLMRK
jgi:hypothetical protein